MFADRKKVLKHHPDKKAGAVGDSNDDAFFKCIQKAFEVLTKPERRRQFDSVDPYYELLEADVPSQSQITKSKNPEKAFFKEFGPVFEREARFSKTQPVPLLGAIDDPKEKVNGFYDFWYNFDSWRSFEYLDKEVNEGSDKYVDPLLCPSATSIVVLTIARPVATTSGTPRRRTSPSAHDVRRRTPPVCATSSIPHLPLTRASSVSARKRRRRVRRRRRTREESTARRTRSSRRRRRSARRRKRQKRRKKRRRCVSNLPQRRRWLIQSGTQPLDCSRGGQEG